MTDKEKNKSKNSKISQTNSEELRDIGKQLRDIRMQLWNIPERCESFTSRSAEVINMPPGNLYRRSFILGSLHKRAAERRCRQNVCVRQTWEGYHWRVLSWSSLPILCSELLRNWDVFRGRWSLAQKFFKQNYCHTCHTKFAVFFPSAFFCVSSPLVNSLFLLAVHTKASQDNVE